MKTYTVDGKPVFSASVPVIEESDPVNAEVTNAPTKQLIENDLALKEMLESKAEPGEGMGFSHNDFTDEYKEAVDGLSGLKFGQDADGSWGYTAPDTAEVVPFGGSGTGMYYCECKTAADVRVKEAPCEGFELKKGVAVLVKFSQSNTALDPLLDIAGTGAQRIMYRGTDSAFIRNGEGYFIASRIYLFTYDGIGYHCVSLPGEETVYAYRRIYGTRSIKSENIDIQNLDVGDLSVSFGGYAQGDLSAAFGAGKASGKWSFAAGQATASGSSAAAFNSGKASGSWAFAAGTLTEALANNSFAEGERTKASAQYSHAEGYYTEAAGWYSHAAGSHTKTSNASSFVIGAYNAEIADLKSPSNNGGFAFVIGNGLYNGADNITYSNALSITFGGTVKAASTITASVAADYAEYFEWEDGNPGFEDRVGYFVTMDGEKIRIAGPGDGYILGIVSGTPFVLGNGDSDVWNGVYLRDEFGRIIYERAPLMEPVEILDGEGVLQSIEWRPVLDADGKQLYKGTRPKINPDYNPDEPYVGRADRPEWAPVGMLGVLSVRQDGSCILNGFCTCGEGGIATACGDDAKNAYRVIKVISEKVVKVVFR